ncbi:prepilin-type N-terminal cleavage/methylation domain-containing protein [Desulfurobacterium pacificum]|uniref:Prepilin-type N-terminal cleavage/methylation domain-containing protein n=1 Tax=Desulfurobacterium pacificum TaxID=240166 RepID=A0ABY1NMI3_9BACT|nr:type II secretion system protein [Desulfurobacterium pacificum]SMP12481.1 prepilin-type N-terminal cleavage/methylation domain-containing protein [Desulfurobacterium pacificum]
MRKAFTLIEMAIVLVILGLIIGIGTGVMIQFIKWNKRQQTAKTVNSATSEAIGLSSEGSINPNSLPTITDAYSQKIVYIIAQKLTSSYLQPLNATICDVKDTQLFLQDNATGAKISNIAFIAFSKGSDYTSNTYCNEKQVNENTICTDNVTTDTTKDIVKYVTLPELKQYLGCPSNPLHILNNQLPIAYVNESYNATLYASGGIKPYKWNITETNCSWIKTKQINDSFTLSGTPTQQGSCLITVSVTDNNTPTPFTDIKTFSIDILQTSNNTSTGACSSYNLTITVSSRPRWKYPISISIFGECVKTLTRGSYTESSLQPSTTITLYENWWCIDENTVVLSGTVSSLDKNGDCETVINCTNGECTSQ